MKLSKKITITPLTSRIIRRLSGYRELESSATHALTIHRQEQLPCRPAVFLKDQLKRITNVHSFSAGLDDEILKATRPTEQHSQTQAFKLNDIFLINGNLCTYKDYKKLTYSNVSASPAVITKEYQTAAMCSSAAGNDYFAHFIFDDACTALLGKEFGQVVFSNPAKRRTEHMLAYLTALGITYEDVHSAWFKELWLFKDTGLNTHRRGRLHTMRNTLSAPHHAACTYIKRGRSGARRHLINEDEITTELQKQGFQVLNPEELPLAQIIKRLNASPIVIGVEGSHLLHAVMNMKSNGTLLCIQPPDRFNAIYRPFTNAIGVNWAFAVGEGTTSGFTLSVDVLMNTLEKCITNSSS